MRAPRTVGLAVSLVLCAAAVVGAVALQVTATATAPTATKPPAGTVSPADPATFAGNSALARRAAAHLLTMAEPPSGAVRVTAAPARLASITINPQVPDYVDDHGFWMVPLPVAAVLTFMAGHPPDGFAATGRSSGGGPETVEDLTFTESTSPAWGSVQSEVAVSRLSARVSGIRVDDVAEWVDPRPESDAGPGLRLRVTVSGRCPTSDYRIVGVESPGRFLTTRMVPAIAPTAARICSYSGLNGHHPLTLVRDRVLGAAPARTIAASAAAASLAHQNGAAYNCPADFGTQIAIALQYPGQPDVDLWYSSSGCSSLSNGRIRAMPAELMLPELLQ